MKTHPDKTNASKLFCNSGRGSGINGSNGSTAVTATNQPEYFGKNKAQPNVCISAKTEITTPKILLTTLHLKQTQSSISKTRQRSSSPAPPMLKQEIQTNIIHKPRVLQRQYAFQKNSKESLNSDRDIAECKTWQTTTKNYERDKNQRGDPDGCDASSRQLYVTTNNEESSRCNNIHNDIKLGSKGRSRQEADTVCVGLPKSKMTSNSVSSKRKAWDNYNGQVHASGTNLLRRQESNSIAKSPQNGKQCAPLEPNQPTKDKGRDNNSSNTNGHKRALSELTTSKVGIDKSQKSTAANKCFSKKMNHKIKPEVNNNHAVEKLLQLTSRDSLSQSYPRPLSYENIRVGVQPNRNPDSKSPLNILQNQVDILGGSGNVNTMGSNHGVCCRTGRDGNKQSDNSGVSTERVLDKSLKSGLEFVVPLESHVEVVEGSPLELWVKIVNNNPKDVGGARVLWVKNDLVIPDAPPDFVYNCNPVDGIFSLRIRDVFIEDSGVYICEAYGNDDESDLICWCNVEVVEDVEDDESIVEIVQSQPIRRKLIVPLIITTSDTSDMDPNIPEYLSQESASERRVFFSNSSANSSRELYEDALEDIHEALDEECEDPEVNLEIEEHRDACQSQESQQDCSMHSDVADVSMNLSSPQPMNTSSPFHLADKEDFSPGLTVYNGDMSICMTNDDSVRSIGDLTNDDLNVTAEEESNSTRENSETKSPPISAEMEEEYVTRSAEHEDPPTGADETSMGVTRPLRSQSSMESGGSEVCRSSSFEDKEFDVSGSSVECNTGYLGTFRDSLSDNPLSPKFLMGPSNLIVMLGETVHLRVKIWTTEDSKTEINWCKLIKGAYQRLDHSFDESSSQHIQITQPTNDLVMMKIPNVTYEDSGKYRVKIHNSYGADYHYCLVSVEGPPQPPATAPTAQYDDINGYIIISWSCCPFDGGDMITGYILELKAKSKTGSTTADETWTVITEPNFKGLCFTFKNPNPSNTFYFRVCVENSHGKGKYSLTSDGFSVPEDSNLAGQRARNPTRKISTTKSLSGIERKSEGIDHYEYKNVELQHKDFLQYYEKHEQLGKGRFGVVFKVTNKETHKSYAGKLVKCRKSSDKERAELEYKIMNDLKYHPKLICLVDAFEMPREIVIVTEMITGGELFERVVADDFTLTERDCVTFLRQICDGAKYIHDKNIMHLDLKPENILCTQKASNQIKIIDFGLAQYYNPNEPIRVLFGTAEFVSPEIINYDTICPATDMWSVGVITYILLSGLSPFLGDDDNETFSNITTGEFDFEDEAFDKISDDAKDFISSLIVKRKEKRLTAKECLEHKWLALSESEKIDIVLSTDKLKRFLLRRKWQKTGNAIRALGRITTLYSSSRRSSSGTSTSSISSPSILGVVDVLRSRAFSTNESIEDSVFAPGDTPHSSAAVAESHLSNVNRSSGITPTESQKREEFTNKSRYDESCRSDSGIGGDAPYSGNYSLE